MEQRSLQQTSAQNRKWIGLCMVVGAVVMGLIGFLSNQSSFRHEENWIGHTPQKKVEHQARVDFYREQLGRKLNRDRVRAELLNQGEAPSLTRQRPPVMDADPVLKGLPLDQEGSHIYSLGRRSSEKLDENSPDGRIQSGLREQQERLAWERAAEKEAVAEFLQNARLQGYKVILDKDLNVVDVRILPRSERELLNRGPAAQPKSSNSESSELK